MEPDDSAAVAAAADLPVTAPLVAAGAWQAFRTKLTAQQKRRRSSQRQDRHRGTIPQKRAAKIRSDNAIAHSAARASLSRATDEASMELQRVIREATATRQARARKRKSDAAEQEAAVLASIPPLATQRQRIDGHMLDDMDHASAADIHVDAMDTDVPMVASTHVNGVTISTAGAAIAPQSYLHDGDVNHIAGEPTHPPQRHSVRLEEELERFDQQLHPVPGLRVMLDGEAAEDADVLDQDDLQTARVLAMAASTHTLPDVLFDLGAVGIDAEDDNADGPSREAVEAIMAEYHEMHLATQGVLRAAMCARWHCL